MENRLFSEYRFKFYLNASHSILINGKQGQVHPHTWELTLNILVAKKGFVAFNVLEKELEAFINKYQDRTLNDIEPFNTVIPTLENITEYFGSEIRLIARNTGGELRQIEASETPTRSYIVGYSQESDYIKNVERASEQGIDEVVDEVLDGIIGVQIAEAALGKAANEDADDEDDDVPMAKVEVEHVDPEPEPEGEEDSAPVDEDVVMDDFDYDFDGDEDEDYKY